MCNEIDPGRDAVDVHEEIFPPERLSEPIVQPPGGTDRIFTAVIDANRGGHGLCRVAPKTPKSYRTSGQSTMSLLTQVKCSAVGRVRKPNAVEASTELAVAVWRKSSGFEVLREPFLAADIFAGCPPTPTRMQIIPSFSQTHSG